VAKYQIVSSSFDEYIQPGTRLQGWWS